MRVLNLLEAEDYFKLEEKALSSYNKAIIMNKEEVAARYFNLSISMECDNNKNLRILHLLKVLTSSTIYDLIDYQVIGNYVDVIVRIEEKVEATAIPSLFD